MVKTKKKVNAKNRINQENADDPYQTCKIGPFTAYATITERLSPFGGLLGLVKFFDLINFREVFDNFYKPPSRDPLLGHYRMVFSVLILLFIGFNRIWHFLYIQMDSMLCSILEVKKLPYVTTFWRYIKSLGINQSNSLLKINSVLRERVWHLCKLDYKKIHIDIDTTVETVFGHQQGARKGHNTKHRGKKGYRPVLCFIEETREYLTGKLRKGETLNGEDFAKLIRTFPEHIPGCVEQVFLRGDGEFISWEGVEAAKELGYAYIFGNKSCKPPFKDSDWYKVGEKDKIAYNSCWYAPGGWQESCRFVVMRIPIDKPSSKKEHVQLPLLEDDKYKYRIFVTSHKKKAHKVIAEYDKRADCENLVGESKREGLSAIPSKKFSSNHAFFQIVMLTFNVWRWFKMMAVKSGKKDQKEDPLQDKSLIDNTIRIARLKLLLIASKITSHSNVTEVKYSEHDSRVASLFQFYKRLDEWRAQKKPWKNNGGWTCKHLAAVGMEQALNPS